MADWIEWASLALGLLGSLGVLYLVIQTLYDRFPRLSYKFESGGFFPARQGWAGEPVGERTLYVIYNFTVWNRTSQSQRLQCSLMVPTLRLASEQGWSSLNEEFCVDTRSAQPVSRLGFEVPPGDGREIAIGGFVRSRDVERSILEFSIRDGRLGKRHWQHRHDISIPPWGDGMARPTATPPAPTIAPDVEDSPNPLAGFSRRP